MARAHLYRPIQDNLGNIRLNAEVRLLEPGTNTPIIEPIYTADTGTQTLSNPFSANQGVVSIYLQQPRRVRLGIKVAFEEERFFEDIDVLSTTLPHNHPESAPVVHTHPYADEDHDHPDLAAELHGHAIGDISGLATVIDPIDGRLDALETGKSATTHTHTGLVPGAHTHDYADPEHTHDYTGDFAPLGHGHVIPPGNPFKSTHGEGLPSTSGRTENDLHYDETSEREFILVLKPGANLSISDNFNKVDGSPLNPASDGGSWTQYARDTSRPNSDPFVYPVDQCQVIESNRARMTYVDPDTGAFIQSSLARKIPGTSDGYEYSVDVFRNRTGGSDLGITLHLLIADPVGRVSQNAFGYRFEFSQYASSGKIVNPRTGASSPASSSYAAWPQGETRRLTVRREGAVLTMLVNGTVVKTWTDPGSAEPQSRWAYFPNMDHFDRIDNFEGHDLAPSVPALTWTSTDEYVAEHIHPEYLTEAPEENPFQSTLGPGLPTLTGRTTGDLHYDETAKKEYVALVLVDDGTSTFGWTPSNVTESGTIYTITADLPYNAPAGSVLQFDIERPVSASIQNLFWFRAVADGTLSSQSASLGPSTVPQSESRTVPANSTFSHLEIRNGDGTNPRYYYPVGHPSRVSPSSWTSTDEYVAVHTHVHEHPEYLTEAPEENPFKSTSGAGLPAFSDRTAGDLHYNETTKQEHILTGSGGTRVVDGFGNRTNPVPDPYATETVPEVLGSPEIGPAYTGTGSVYGGVNSGAFLGKARLQSSGGQDSAFTVTAPIGTGPSEISVVGAQTSGVRWNLNGGFYQLLDSSSQSRHQFSLHRNGVPLDISTEDFVGQGFDNYNLVFSMSPSGLLKAVITSSTGVQRTLQYQDPAPVLTGSGAGVTVSANSILTLDAWTLQALGTLAWTSTDDYVAPHSHPAGSTTSTGPGLPPFAGRKSGDQHYDETVKKEYALTGIGGASLADDFTGLNATLTTLAGLPVTGVGAITYARDNNAALLSLANGASSGFHVAVVGSPGQQEVSALVQPTTPGLGGIFCSSTSGGTQFSNLDGYVLLLDKNSQNHFVRLFRAGSNVASFDAGNQGLGAGTVAHLLRLLVTAEGANYRVRGYLNGTEVISYLDTSPLTTGTLTGLTLFSGASNTARFDNFSYLGLGTLAWTSTDEYVAPHTHGRADAAAVNTVGAGKPSFAGRLAGDLHLDTDIGRALVLTGVPGSGGTPFSDDFNGGTNGTALTGTRTGAAGNWTGTLGTMRYSSGAAVATAISSGRALYRILADSPNGQVNSTSLTADGSGILGFRVQDTISYYYADFRNKQLVRVASGNSAVLATWTESPGVGGLQSVSFLAGVFTVYINSIQVATATDTTFQTGNAVGIGATAVGDGADNFSYGAAQGTLRWEVSEPIYLQAQLASGPVATGTHVLKPGLRVPAASNLREVVLRCDTAPVDAPITVTVERFNNGTSQGIIATASIATGMNVGSVVGLNAAMAKGDILKFNVTSVGSTTAGSDLTISLDIR